MMFLLAVLCVFYIWSPATLTGGLGSTPNTIPRKTVPISSNGGRLFREEGVWNYTTMLLREDLNMLILGAREAIFALELDDITVKKATVNWPVTNKEQIDCSNKGKDATNDCKNYIRILHKRNDDRMYVCHDFPEKPNFIHMAHIREGESNPEGDEDKLYLFFSETAVEYDSYTKMDVSRVARVCKSFTENEPNFIHMAHIREGESNPEGDEDKLYLFFSEEIESGSVLKAVNYNSEMAIMEEIQLFGPSEPVKILRISNTKLYVGSDVGVVQLSINECGRYHTCLDCVLARDPYCGWDLNADQCSTINSTHRTSTVIQNLSYGNASRCPQTGYQDECQMTAS
ncbi:semaphorin-4E-like [Sinocyclocheilus grahami]|uniref:semaphorin-4E-like n=1 Tax=Sinocyclocheilus grahami TaxID=75366 RepID=UPI0007AD3737|nr:PREDICTED: semaphorin-4E-like [Sinocyclocheilus grahami]